MTLNAPRDVCTPPHLPLAPLHRAALNVALRLHSALPLRPPAVPAGSNGKSIWTKAHPMNDEEVLQQQVVMTTSASQIGQTVWVYRGSMWAYRE